MERGGHGGVGKVESIPQGQEQGRARQGVWEAKETAKGSLPEELADEGEPGAVNQKTRMEESA